MAIVLTDFDKIWASTSPLTPYSFSDANYEEGWNFIGSTPPARQMWDSIQKFNDEKMKYIADNYMSVIGTVVSDSLASSISVVANTGTELCKVTLSAGVWVVTGHAYYSGLSVDKIYGITLSATSGAYQYAGDSSIALMTSTTGAFAMQTTRIVTMLADGDYYLNAYTNVNATVTNADMNAVRIK